MCTSYAQAFQEDLLDWFKKQDKSPPAECQ